MKLSLAVLSPGPHTQVSKKLNPTTVRLNIPHKEEI